jgi:hypothetical protein
MDHMENKCIRLDGVTLAEMREKKAEFSKNLEALTQETVKANYANCMPSVAGDTRSRIMGQSPRQATSENTPPYRGRSTESKVLTGTDPTQEHAQVRSEATPSSVPKAIHEISDISHPDHPSFNSARHYSAIMEMYVCPKVGCG